MRTFDCLARDCPLFGPHLLEASAGTGKTFSIEHIFVRLVLEGIEVEQILAVTFTRAATRELKARIRANLEKALFCINAKQTPWSYLEPHFGSQEAVNHLTDALAVFDQCQIFTIHGFCYRMLQEFAFEAHVSLSLPDPDKKQIPERLKQAAADFLENGIEPTCLCPEQGVFLLRDFASTEELIEKLLRLDRPAATTSFSTLFDKCKAALHCCPHRPTEEKLMEDFRALETGHKAADKGNVEAQIKALANLDDPISLRYLIREKGKILSFLDPDNRKVKAKDPEFLHYPRFFDWARAYVGPLLKQKPLPALQSAWMPIAEKILAEEEHLNPDEILLQMKKAVHGEAFAAHVREKYAAVIIDEFQDTDATQWEIFQTLFIGKGLRALYLVGDPKQSIYRFRKADVYTYLKARDALGEEHLYHLDTNFRSTKKLVSALNTLFARNWLHLPKANRTLPFHPVKAGAEIEADFGDEKGALHFCIAEGEPGPLFDEAFLPFAVNEIERLQLKKCAILVRAHYQAEIAFDLLQSRGIAAVVKSHAPIGQTASFKAVKELFDAILSPHDRSAGKVVMAGPFASSEISFSDLRLLLEESGLVSFARAVCRKPLSSDMMQIFELLFAWEKREGFSFEGLRRYLRHLQDLKADEGGARCQEVDEEAVQIMTMHISKGLEFDVVFALGLATRTPEAEEEIEEIDAEKLRQLYVAMTRAKKRLYVPLALSKKEADPGAYSPMELFCRHLETGGPLLDRLSAFARAESITLEQIASPFTLGPCKQVKPEGSSVPYRPEPNPYTPIYLASFTTLAKEGEIKRIAQTTEEGFTLQTMPRGSETGIAIHHIFETLFSSPRPIWRDAKAIEALVAQELRFSPLAPWKVAIAEMVKRAMKLPLEDSFSLSELEPNQLRVEMEFLYATPPHFVKGFIDLIFTCRGKIYFLDWKTNYLENYTPAAMQEAMEMHDYKLQAELYAEAIKRYYNAQFGGAFYFFLRGGVALYLPGAGKE